MSGRNGLALPGPQVQPQMLLAQPLNDTQLLALVAAQLYDPGTADPARYAVALAIDLVAEAAVQLPGLGALVRSKQQDRREAPEG